MPLQLSRLAVPGSVLNESQDGTLGPLPRAALDDVEEALLGAEHVTLLVHSLDRRQQLVGVVKERGRGDLGCLK